ncbi:hypothetical protein Pfo_031625 [Paulownia fortunei]|nr:hypothetical protein Pfo_031625 [Paulownia fortunei]
MDLEKKTKWSSAGALIALGIVYGDIGTSPLYTMNSILNSARSTQHLNEFVIGSVSLVFWTLMLITTIKYVLIALRADNHGEGGIFALYSRVQSVKKKWLLIPALIGGSALLADGTLTPAVTVTTAIEGLKGQGFGILSFPNDQFIVMVTVTVILVIIFLHFSGQHCRPFMRYRLDYCMGISNSHNMEAAYGLSITITMLMTTVLLFEFVRKYQSSLVASLFAIVFGFIEVVFLIASLGSKPKRAAVYWFVTVREATDPYEKSYAVDMMGTTNMVHVTFKLGFKVEPQIHLYIKQIANDLIKKEVLKPQFPRYAIDKHGSVSDFKYVIANQYSADLLRLPNIHPWDRFLIGGRFMVARPHC